MDDYKSNFINKLIYIKMMVNAQGKIRFPIDWFDVATTKASVPDGEQLHSAHTSFRMESLLKIYEEAFKKFLLKNNITFIQDEKELTFYKS